MRKIKLRREGLVNRTKEIAEKGDVIKIEEGFDLREDPTAVYD